MSEFNTPPIATTKGTTYELVTTPLTDPFGQDIRKPLRDAIGTDPILLEGQSLPNCADCGQPMVCFLQFDIREEFGTGLIPGSHVVVMNCVEEGCGGELPPDGYSDLTTEVGSTYPQAVRGPSAIWINKPDQKEHVVPCRKVVRPYRVDFQKKTETIESSPYLEQERRFSQLETNKVGGVASWINYDVRVPCPCGGMICYFAQLMLESASPFFDLRHPIVGHGDYYHLADLYLSNNLFLLACDRQCRPQSVVVVYDN